jgi:hypothetical protein
VINGVVKFLPNSQRGERRREVVKGTSNVVYAQGGECGWKMVEGMVIRSRVTVEIK